MENKISKIINVLIFFSWFAFSCNNNESNMNNNQTEIDSSQIVTINTIKIKSPEFGKVFSRGDKVELKFTDLIIKENDSLTVSVNNKTFVNYKVENGALLLSTDSLNSGKNNINIELNISGKSKFAQTMIVVKASHAPIEYSYKVLARFPHDDKSYTQGLVFYKGLMYEGSGQYGESSLRRYKLETGELLQTYNLPSNVFGEGIVIYENKIYQLTWQSHICYEYDLESFKLLRTFQFNTEGWGITKYKEFLIMSDGSNTLYFLNPETFTEVKRIEVYNNVGPVVYLNELELVEGKIYANVYQTNDIVIINPENGFVEGVIHLAGLLDQKKVKREPDVLNGIAYDNDKKRLFLTGKYWPEIYQIEILPKQIAYGRN